MQQENILQISLKNPKGLIEKKCLKRWFAYSADIENCSILRSKLKKIDKENKEPISDNDMQSKLLNKLILTNFKDFFDCDLSFAWAQTSLSETIEWPIPLLGHLTFLKPFMIYLKCLPESHTTYSSIMKQITFFADTINTLDYVELKTVSLNEVFDLHFISHFSDCGLLMHQFSNQGTFSCKEFEQMLHLRTSLFSVMEYLRPLFQNISKSGKNKKIKAFHRKKIDNSKNSENIDLQISSKTIKNQTFNKKVPAILKEINENNWFPEKGLNGYERIFSAFSLKPDAPNNLDHAYSSATFSLLSKMDDESHQKQSWAPSDMNFHLAKFNLDYEEISGTAERFLNTINLENSKYDYMPLSSEKNGNEVLTDSLCHHFVPPVVPKETSINLKESTQAETLISLEEQNISTPPDNFVNNIHTLITSDQAQKDNLFSEDLTIKKKNMITILSGDSINNAVNEDKSFSADNQVSCNETTEHVVPDINLSQIHSVTETSMYEEECPGLKEFGAKSVFCWTSDSLNISVSDQFSYPSTQQSSRPLRLGLSKKQKVKHLHKK